MATKTQRKAAVADAVADVAKTLVEQIDREVEIVDNGKLLKTNKHGKMLMCEVTLQKAPGKPDPQCFTVNDEIKWVKRGAKVVVPWYFVEHMLHNVERKYRQEVDPADARKKIVLFDDMTTEAFNYREIDPADGVFVEGPREQPNNTL